MGCEAAWELGIEDLYLLIWAAYTDERRLQVR